MSLSNYIYLANKKKGLLQPYPHMVRTLLGSGIISLVFAVILIIFYVSYQTVALSVDFFQQKINTLSWNKAALPDLPIPKVIGQDHREVLLHTTIPYIEKITLPITDRARQADFALIQTLNRLDMEKDHFFLVAKEYRQHKNEVYHFQKIRLFLSQEPQVFIQTLQEHLDAWAEHVSLKTYNNCIYLLTINEIPTHEITLVPINDSTFIVSPTDEKPRISIVIDDLGESVPIANTLISLEIPVTLSIWPDSTHAASIATAAHEAGREVLIHQPMQSIQAPYVSAGPKQLTVTMSQKEIEEILDANIKKVPFASGLNNHMGSAFTCNEEGNRIVCNFLAKEGLFVLDSVTHNKSSFYDVAQKKGLAAYRRTIFLDDGIHSEASVTQRLKYAEKVAYATGKAIVIGHPYPETITALKKWTTTKDTSIHIVPLRYQEISTEPLESHHF